MFLKRGWSNFDQKASTPDSCSRARIERPERGTESREERPSSLKCRPPVLVSNVATAATSKQKSSAPSPASRKKGSQEAVALRLCPCSTRRPPAARENKSPLFQEPNHHTTYLSYFLAPVSRDPVSPRRRRRRWAPGRSRRRCGGRWWTLSRAPSPAASPAPSPPPSTSSKSASR